MKPLWRHQLQALEFISRLWRSGRRGVLLAMHMGCVAGDADLIVNRGGNSKHFTLREFHRKFQGGTNRRSGKDIAWNPQIPSQIRSLIHGELHLNTVIQTIARGIRPVVKIRLASGKFIRVTPDHEIAAPGDQWIAADRLSPGDQVLTNGQAACRDCGSTERIIVYPYAKHLGLCRKCAWSKGQASRHKEKIIDKDGYVRLYRRFDHPRHNRAGQVYEHIVVMEKILGRPIIVAEHVHHKNHVRHDNRPENLEVLSEREHLRHHGLEGHHLHLDSAPHVCFIPRTDTVVAVEPNGESDVYDLVMDEPAHNFVANGVLVHNCGKSRVAVEAAVRHKLRQILILCPLRVVEVWREQFEMYAPEYHFIALDDRWGTVAQKTMAAMQGIEWALAHDRPIAIAINYESARLSPFAHWSANRRWPLVITDEGHRLKCPSGAISRFVGRLGLVATHRLGLTGTPMPHSPLDVWAQFRFIDRTLYDPTYTSFRTRYAEMDAFFAQKVKSYKNLEDLREKFFTLAFQVGPEVLDLPAEQDQYLSTRLSPEGAQVYAQMERDLIAFIEAGGVVTAANQMVRLLRLAQIVSGVVTDEDGRERIVDESKRRLLEDLLEDLAADEPVVVFCRFRADLAAVHAAARALGRSSGELSGEQDDLARWKRGGPEDPVILAVQIQAGGVGVSLARARYAVYYSIGFSLADYLQSRARLHRPGQTRPVLFYHLMVEDTIDHIIRGALARRHDLIESVLEELPKCTSHPSPTKESRAATPA